MLIIGGGGDEALTGLQNLTIVAAVPFVIVMVLLCVALYKDLRTDRVVAVDRRSTELVERAVVAGAGQYGDDFDLVTESRSDVSRDI
jgi:choline-glycine betaine transporter